MSYIAYLDKVGNKINEEKLNKFFGKCIIFQSISCLLASEDEFSAIAIYSNNSEKLLNYIKKIRQSDRCYLTPLILDRKNSSEILFPDGYFDDLEKASVNCQKINRNIKQLNLTNVDRWKSKVLAFLYTRPELVIKPIADWQSRLYYTFPLLDLFCVNIENYFYWLDDLKSDGFLSEENLVDKVFCCPFCLSAHMKFTDHCPNCNSINIREEEFLHCFTCGLVAPQSEFLKNDRFVCPRCNSKLKHIGDDYDRPLENGVCNDCNFYFTETVLEATCMICDKKYPAESLIKRSFYEYKLTEIGKGYIKNNTYDIGQMLADSGNYLTQPHFYSRLDWLILMQRRYKTDFFSIIGLNFKLMMDDFDYERLHDFAEHLRGMLRTTDICTRLHESFFWIVLAKTDSKDVDIVKERIINIYSKLQKDNVKQKLKLVSFSSNPENISDDNAKVLIAKLGTEL